MEEKVEEVTLKFQQNFIRRLGKQFKNFLGSGVDNKILEKSEDSLEFQQDPTPDLEKQFWFLRKDSLSPEEFRNKQENEIERLSDEIQAMQNERDQNLARWNQYIEQRITILNNLKKKIEELKNLGN